MHRSRAQRGINHIDNAHRNKHILLSAIREGSGSSRTELSRISDLSLATTKRLVDELMVQGLIDERAGSREVAGRGRRPTMLSLGQKGGFAIGIDLGPESLGLAGLAFDGEIIFRKSLRPGIGDRDRLVALIIAEARLAIEACASAGRGGLLGVGMGIAGLVNAREGRVFYCPGLPGWDNFDLEAVLREGLGTKAIVDDGVRCMALAEKRYGSARGLDTFLYIYIGRGVGSGIILDNRIYRGKNGVSGEFGHISVREDGPLCSCGNRGCLEALASTRAILARTRDLLDARVLSSLPRSDPSGRGAGTKEEPISLTDIDAAAAAGDKLACMVVSETEESIGIGIASLVNIFDPGTVILAGEVVERLERFVLDGVRRIVRLRSLHSISQRTEIRKGAIDGDPAALGAATMVVERFLETEILNL